MVISEKYEWITLFKVKNVPIKLHWSVIVLILFLSIFTLSRGYFPVPIFSILFVLIVHELGHMWFASWSGLKTTKIEITPIGGVCYSQEAETEYENAFVAWGGVVAQAIIFIPVIAFSFFIDTNSYELTELIKFLGIYNAVLAMFNLIPFATLDGEKAWAFIPLYLKYGKINRGMKKKKKNLDFESSKYDRWRK